MKLILIATILMVVSQTDEAYGQNTQYSAPGKVYTFEEANRLNGTAQPTINGKPYSQYKAEQEALKRQASALNQAGYVSPMSATTPEPARTVMPNQKPDNTQVPAAVEGALVKPAAVQPKQGDAAANQTGPGALSLSNGVIQIDASSAPLSIPSLKVPDKTIETKGSPSESIYNTHPSGGKAVPVKIEGSIAPDAPKVPVSDPAKTVSASPVATQEPAKAAAPSLKVKTVAGQGN